MKERIIITGVTWSWKSTIWKALSGKLDVLFIDVDDLVKTHISKSDTPRIAEFASRYGFETYLKLESEIWEDIIWFATPWVISTSWNTLLQQKNRDFLWKHKGQSPLFYLRIPAKTSVHRVLNDKENYPDRISEALKRKFEIDEICWGIYRKAIESEEILEEISDRIIDGQQDINHIVRDILR